MSMSLTLRQFRDRIAELGFSAQLPADWISHELPAEEPDFSQPITFFPLALVTAPHAAIVFAFAARPAFDDGTLHDWAWYLLNNNGLAPRAIGPHPVAGVPALVGEATQPSDLGPMVVRFAFFEDGGRLVNITLTAPELLADAVYEAWTAMLVSFQLATPKGSRFNEETVMPPPAPAAQPQAGSTALPASAADDAPQEDPTFASFAFADTPATLDPENKVNANLRERGIGLVPNVVSTDDAAKCATLAAGAIQAFVQVPYGWYVIDDGKRTLVLHPKDEVQINLDLLRLKEGGFEGLLDELEAQVRSDYPDPQTLRTTSGKIHALGVRNIAVNGEAIEQMHMLHPHHMEGMVLRARVTASPAMAVQAGNLADLILQNVTAGPADAAAAQSAPTDGPAWWRKALALERQDRFEEAEQAIRDGVPHLSFAQAIADMYRRRMLRLKQAGDAKGALDAFKRSSNFIFFYASQATSGGEGAALSAERDAFRAELVKEYGGDPEAVQ